MTHYAEGPPEHTCMRTHDGADYFLTKAFVDAVRDSAPFTLTRPSPRLPPPPLQIAYCDTSPILSGATETLETHLMTFAAEVARKTSSVVEIGPHLELEPHVPDPAAVAAAEEAGQPRAEDMAPAMDAD